MDKHPQNPILRFSEAEEILITIQYDSDPEHLVFK